MESGFASPTIKDGRDGRDRSSISGIKLQFRPCEPPLPIWRLGRVRPCEQALRSVVESWKPSSTGNAVENLEGSKLCLSTVWFCGRSASVRSSIFVSVRNCFF